MINYDYITTENIEDKTQIGHKFLIIHTEY